MAMAANPSARLARATIGSIADLVDSAEACVLGTVRTDHVLLSPSGYACAAYRFRDSAGHDEFRVVPFVVEDDTGEAVVEAANAILVVTVHEGTGLHSSIVGSKYLANHGVPGTHHEQRIEVGARIYVIGACTRELDPNAGAGLYRDRPGSRVRFAHTDEIPLLLADRLTPTEPAPAV